MLTNGFGGLSMTAFVHNLYHVVVESVSVGFSGLHSSVGL